MIYGMASPSPPWPTSTATAAMFNRGCRCCRPGSDTSTRSRPTGTCNPSRNCSPWPPTGSNPRTVSGHDRTRADPAGVLHRQADTTTPRRPEHPRRLPRHLPAATQFASTTTATAPSGLDLAQIDAWLVTAFLAHRETDRGNTAATRNARLAAIHSLFRYAALRAPEHADQIARVLPIPPKRCDRAVV